MSVSLFMNLSTDVQHKPVQVPHALKVHEHLLATKNNPFRWYDCYAEVPHNGRDFISDGEVDIHGGGAVRPDVAAEQAASHGEARRFLLEFCRCHLQRRPQISTRNRSESLRIITKPTSFLGGTMSLEELSGRVRERGGKRLYNPLNYIVVDTSNPDL